MEDSRKRTVLITGVAGLLGSRLAEWIKKQHGDNVTVIGIDDLSGGYGFNIPSNIFYLYGDLYDVDVLKRTFEMYEPDIVYHFAAYAAEGLSPFIRGYNYINNTVATANVITACIEHGVDRLVFTSSMAVYGNQAAPFHEDLTPQPIDPYGIAKFAAEQDIQVAGQQHGLDWCIIRPHNVYGRNQNISDSYRNVLGIWMYKHMNGEPLSIFGDGQQTRAFSYIDDSLEPLWKAGTDPRASRRIINLGGIHQYTIAEAAETLIEVMGGGELEYLPQRHEVKHAWATYEKSEMLLDFEHKTGLREGLLDMWQWASNLDEVPPRTIWLEYELNEGLYPFWEQDWLKGRGQYNPMKTKLKITKKQENENGND